MVKSAALREKMDMPDPLFPIKVHYCKADRYGQSLFRNHWHKHLELLYFISGKALIECNSEEMTFAAGELAVINSNDLHGGVCLSDDLFYYALIVDPSLLHSQSKDSIETKFITPLTQNRLMFRNKTANPSAIGEEILSIVRELQERELGYELSVKAHLYRILTQLLRHEVAHVQTLDDYALRLKNLERFSPIFQFIETHFAEELSVELLAGKAGLSRFHFGRLFKELTGKTTREYINDVRINKAEYLLCNSSLTVSEIALQTGFSDIYYFSRAFKKSTDTSPSELRSRLR